MSPIMRNHGGNRPAGEGVILRDGAMDVSELPSHAFGYRSILWWGTLGVIAIEGTVFAMALVTYFYLRNQVDAWPPGVPPPSLFWGTVNTLVLVGSMVPNELAKRAGEHYDRAGCRVWMTVALLFAVVFLVVRVFEFRSLNVSWDYNAYGSITWFILGLHTVHLVTDFFDTAILDALVFTGPWEMKRFVDVQENAVYWYFVVLAWLPIYAVVYWAPRIGT